MGIIEYHEGCKELIRITGNPACFGPSENFYTLFGTEFRFLYLHFLISIIIGLVLFVILFQLNKRNKIKLNKLLIILIPLIITILLFFIFAYFYRVKVVY